MAEGLTSAAAVAAPTIGDRTVTSAPVTPLGSITEPQVYPRPQQLQAGGSAVSVPANAAPGKVATPAAPPQRTIRSSTVRRMTTSRTDTVGIGYAARAGAILSASA